MNLSTAEVNYLSAIHRLSRKGKRVSTNALAGEFSIAPASVTDMVQKLAEKNLVEYIPYKGVNLSEKGLPIAEKTNSGTTLWSRFLSDYLGLEEEKAEEYSAQFQSVRSEEIFTRLQEFLANETPTKTIVKEVIKKVEVPVVVEKEVIKEVIKEVERTQPNEQSAESLKPKPFTERKKESVLKNNSLAKGRIGKVYKVVGVEILNDEVLGIIQLYHIKIGSKIRIITQYEIDDSYLIQIGDEEFIMGRKIVEQILIH